MIEVYDGHNKRIALHVRGYTGPRYVTKKEHMTKEHAFKAMADRFDGNRYRNWARSIGESTYSVIDALLEKAGIEEKAYRSCMGILQSTKKYGNNRLEAACRRAMELSSPTYSTVYNILKNRQELSNQPDLFRPVMSHENLRGAASFM